MANVESPVARGRGRLLECLKAYWKPEVLGVLYLVLFLPQIVYLARVSWQEEKYSHGWLIPAVSAFFLWVNREALGRVLRKPAGSGLALVSLGILMWVLAQGRSFNALAHLSMMVVLVGMVAFAAGWRYLRAVAFPVFYLVFCFPVPKRLDDIYVTLPLQRLASTISEHVIDLCGIPVFRQGNVIEVPGIQLLVEEACSGIHSLYSLVALGVAFVFLTERRWWERLVLIISTVPIAIFANVFRVSVTGILASAISPELAKGFFHEFSGLLVFLLGLSLLLLWAWVLRLWFPWDEEPRPPEPAPGRAGDA